MMNIELGKKIAALRKMHKITQAQLAEYLSVQPQTISRWEAEGGMPEVTLLPKIAMFFSISLDELFGMTNMEQINNLVHKYSVLRDDKSFEEVMRSIDLALDSIEEQLQSSTFDEQLVTDKEQLLAWKVHIYIQKSRKAMQQAEDILDELMSEIKDFHNPLYGSLILQKQQFRIQGGEGKLMLQQAKNKWESEPTLFHLHCYMAALWEREEGADILALWDTELVQRLVNPVNPQTAPLWELMFYGAHMEKDLAYFERYFSAYTEVAGEASVFEIEWTLTKLYNELGMAAEKDMHKFLLLERIQKLSMNEYFRELYRKQIEEL